MRRGTRVGQAYVAVTADGDGINEEIVDSVNEAGPGVERAGKEHGERYSDEFGDSLRVKFSHVGDKASAELNRRMGVAGDDGADQYGDQFEKTMKRISKRIGKNIGKSIGESLLTDLGRMIDTFENSVSRNGGGAGGGGADAGPGSQKPGTPQTDYSGFDFFSKFEMARKKLHEQANLDIEKNDRELLKTQQSLYDKAAKEAAARDKDAAKRDSEMWRIRNITAKAHYKYLADLDKGRIDEQGNLLSRLGNGKDNNTIGDTIGRLFGAGSRNNFLNIFGKSLGGIVNVTEKVASSAGKMFTLFSKGFSEAEQGASFFQKALSGFSELGAGAGGGLSKAFSSIAASGPGAVVAILAIVAAMAVLVSVVGALIGLITALVAAIANALTGALLVLGGAFAAVAAAAGLLVVAFTSMTDAQKKMLTQSFLPLKAELTGLGQIMLKDMVPAFKVWSDNLQRALLLALPVAQVMGKAFADAGSIITAAFSGPGFQLFAQMLTTTLPAIVTKLSVALGQFLNGLTGMFAALLPSVNQFAGYLARIATEFATWATSAQGQNSIKAFVDQALVSLASLWNALSAIGGFLVQVFFSPEATKAGNSIFDSIAKTFRSLTEKIKKAQADGSFKKWFDDAIKFGSALWEVIQALTTLFMALYDSGVLKILGYLFKSLSFELKFLAIVLTPVVKGLGLIGDAIDWVAGRFKSGASQINTASNGIFDAANTIWRAAGIYTQAMHMMSNNAGAGSANAIPGQLSSNPGFGMDPSGLQASGMNALNNTSVKNGGFKQPKQWHNPYVAFANSLIKQGPSVSAQIKNAMLALNKSFAAGILAAAKDTGGESAVRDALTTMMSNLVTGGASVVNTARDALNSAAQSLASATSKGAAMKALKQVRAAQKNLKAALKDQSVLNAIAKGLKWQQTVDWAQVSSMVKGLGWTNASLATLAAGRARVAALLDTANQKLADAIALRDQYKQTVTDSAKAFASLATAQAQTIDGIEQALTSNDITTNLQDKLDAIKHFQNDLQLLIAQGLSDDAYKQIVDQGVAGGTPIADALLAGGQSAIQQTNSLVDQINGVASQLGIETSNRLYQAGVSAAQGLVDGLTSLSAQLDAAAVKLGNSIAASVKKALGIKSPSSVMRDMMDYVGDGMALGLGNQHVKVGSAAAALSDVIGVSPGTYSRKTTTDEGTVSGNGQLFGDLHVHTPTENPKAVAIEAVNELVGRLP